MAAANTFVSTPTPTYSPWGGVQHATEIGPGLWSVSTAGHGGMLLSPERNAVMPDYLRADSGWYEEDCEWSLVALVFPELFDAEAQESAHVSARHWRPDEYERFTGRTIAPGESYQRDRTVFYRDNPEAWVTSSAWGDWAAWVPDGMVGVVARQGKPGSANYNLSERYFLVTEGEYRATTPVVGFVLDLDRHQEIARPVNFHDRTARAA